MGYAIDNRLRRLLQNPLKILAPYVTPGMTVMDLGCGMGFFSIAAARLVGDQGRIVAVDLQQRMLDTLRKRATRAGVADRIHTHRCQSDSLGIDQALDFAYAFYVVHEVTDAPGLLRQLHELLKPQSKLLVAEPAFHVSQKAFQITLSQAAQADFTIDRDIPPIAHSRSAILLKNPPK